VSFDQTGRGEREALLALQDRLDQRRAQEGEIHPDDECTAGDAITFGEFLGVIGAADGELLKTTRAHAQLPTRYTGSRTIWGPRCFTRGPSG